MDNQQPSLAYKEYKEDSNYINGFMNTYRNSINFINYNNSTFASNSCLNISSGQK